MVLSESLKRMLLIENLVICSFFKIAEQNTVKSQHSHKITNTDFTTHYPYY